MGAALFSIEIWTLSPIISLKCAEFVALMGIVVLVPRQPLRDKHAFGMTAMDVDKFERVIVFSLVDLASKSRIILVMRMGITIRG